MIAEEMTKMAEDIERFSWSMLADMIHCVDGFAYSHIGLGKITTFLGICIPTA